ncbi:hypothetical protein BLNAU_14073 [Blattamonas nauphoetae]|uniref:Uncharacterized protein n=1 Tax=Blattamonas nauphoetae TaxID=2049346 RepID=A0ABQ9XLH3_9EUKA|nr:hypothetical protein BLNAU_14073 [Blattamonas nauphoetae]
MMIVIALVQVLEMVDIELEPLVREAYPSKMLNLTSGTYSGKNIAIVETEMRKYRMFHVSGDEQRDVTLKPSSQSDSLFLLTNISMSLTGMRIIVPTNNSFIKTFEDSYLLMIGIVHDYSTRNFAVIEDARYATILMRNHTFQPNSRFGCPIVQRNEEGTAEDNNELAMEWSKISGIIMTKDVPFLTNAQTGNVSMKNNVFEDIRFAANVAGQKTPAPTIVLQRPLHQAWIQNNTLKNCDGPLTGGLGFFHLAKDVYITNTTVDSSTNLMLGSLASPFTGWSYQVVSSNFSNCVSTPSNQNGSALYVGIAEDVLISNSHFKNNTAAVAGGAVWIGEGCMKFVVENSSFLMNRAAIGGAISVIGQKGQHGSPSRVDSTQFANIARLGSDLHFDDIAKLNVTSESFGNCRSRSGSPRVYDGKTKKGYEWTN